MHENIKHGRARTAFRRTQNPLCASTCGFKSRPKFSDKPGGVCTSCTYGGLRWAVTRPHRSRTLRRLSLSEFIDRLRRMANDATRAERGRFLTLMTILFLLLAVSDFTKPLEFVRPTTTSGIVEFGHRFRSVWHTAILGAMFGVLFVVYAYGLWNLRRWVLPIAIAYAFYVPFNVVLFNRNHEEGAYSVGFTVIWLAVALTGSIGTAIYIAYHRERLS